MAVTDRLWKPLATRAKVAPNCCLVFLHLLSTAGGIALAITGLVLYFTNDSFEPVSRTYSVCSSDPDTPNFCYANANVSAPIPCTIERVSWEEVEVSKGGSWIDALFLLDSITSFLLLVRAFAVFCYWRSKKKSACWRGCKNLLATLSTYFDLLTLPAVLIITFGACILYELADKKNTYLDISAPMLQESASACLVVVDQCTKYWLVAGYLSGGSGSTTSSSTTISVPTPTLTPTPAPSPTSFVSPTPFTTTASNVEWITIPAVDCDRSAEYFDFIDSNLAQSIVPGLPLLLAVIALLCMEFYLKVVDKKEQFEGETAQVEINA